MAVALENLAEIDEQVSQIEEKNRVSSEHLEQISKLENNIQDNVESAAIADEITQIQLIVHDANELARNKKFYLLLAKVDQAICNIKSFHDKYQKPLPERIFEDLHSDLETHRKNIDSIRRSIRKLQRWSKTPQKSCGIENLVSGFEALSKCLEGNLELFPYHDLIGLEKCLRRMASKDFPKSKSKGQPFIPMGQKDKERFYSAAHRLIHLTEQAKTYVLATRSAEVKAIERIQGEDFEQWETILDTEQEINIEEMNAWLEKRGYKTEISCEDQPAS